MILICISLEITEVSFPTLLHTFFGEVSIHFLSQNFYCCLFVVEL